jgi:2-deoxy-D-gluconate 3-dehydrogenase
MSILESFTLSGKVALVTGASRGIGEGIAMALAEAGADLALVARSGDALEQVAGRAQALGRRAVALPLDVANLDGLPGVVDQAASALGAIDILVNAAGVTRRQPILEVGQEDWDYVVGTNLRSVYFMSQAVAKKMVTGKRGKIINIASMTSFRGFPAISLYGISKTGIVAMTRAMAVEWATHHIQVNAIAPGWIETAMTATMTPERRQWVNTHLPQGQFGTPRDLAGLAVYLASPASDYTTGQVIPVDGGFLAGNPW